MSTPEHIDSADLGRPRTEPVRRRESDVLVSRPMRDKPLRRESDGWLERWMATVADLARLKASHPMLDAVIDEQERTPDPDRRPLARGLRLVQLPGLRPRSGDHRRGPRVPREVGHPPVLVPAARKPRAVRADRGDHDRAARVRGLAAAPDDHPHPHVGDPDPGRQRRDVPGRPGAQDDLRRREHRPRARRDDPALPAQRRRAPRAARQGVEDHPTRDRDRRGELDDRERARREGVRAHRPRERRAPVHRRRPRVRRDRRTLPRRAVRMGHCAATASSAIRARRTTTSSSSRGSARRTARCCRSSRCPRG